MRIVLNQSALAEEIISTHNLGPYKDSYENLSLVARYYYSQGIKKRDIRKKLEVLFGECYPKVPALKREQKIDKIVRKAGKYPLIDIESIPINRPEMDRIDSLPSEPLKRLAFTLLCIAKYRILVNENASGWVSTEDREIMSMANIRETVRNQCMMFGRLKQLGYISFPKRVDNTNVRVLFFEDGEPILQIKDFRNLGYQYQMYHGVPCYVCIECGLICKKTGRNPNKSHRKYCEECKTKIHRKQMAESAARRRAEETK